MFPTLESSTCKNPIYIIYIYIIPAFFHHLLLDPAPHFPSWGHQQDFVPRRAAKFDSPASGDGIRTPQSSIREKSGFGVKVVKIDFWHSSH